MAAIGPQPRRSARTGCGFVRPPGNVPEAITLRTVVRTGRAACRWKRHDGPFSGAAAAPLDRPRTLNNRHRKVQRRQPAVEGGQTPLPSRPGRPARTPLRARLLAGPHLKSGSVDERLRDATPRLPSARGNRIPRAVRGRKGPAASVLGSFSSAFNAGAIGAALMHRIPSEVSG